MSKNAGLERFFNGLSELVPFKTKTRLFAEFEFAGITENHRVFLGKHIFRIIISGIIGFLLGGFLIFFFFQASAPIAKLFFLTGAGMGFLALATILFHLKIFYQLQYRTNEVEKNLPDFLSLVASNINASMTPFVAFRAAARKEFGSLSKEVQFSTAKSLGTQSFSSAFSQLTKKINSQSLQETLIIFTEAQRAGGHLAKLLEKLAQNLRNKQELKKELVTSTKMYVLFVLFVILIATPALLAVSVQFLKMISAIQAQNQFATEAIAGFGFLSTKPSVSAEFMQGIAFSLLILNALLSSLFIGLLQTGKAKMGLRLFPLLWAGSTVAYAAIAWVISGILGG